MNPDTARSRRRLIIAYGAVWLLLVLVFWCLIGGSDAMAYALFVIWGLHPLAIVVFSALLGAKGCWVRRRWALPLLFGVMYMLAPYLTFSLANTLAAGHINPLDLEMLLLGAVLSLAGLACGAGLRRR